MNVGYARLIHCITDMFKRKCRKTQYFRKPNQPSLGMEKAQTSGRLNWLAKNIFFWHTPCISFPLVVSPSRSFCEYFDWLDLPQIRLWTKGIFAFSRLIYVSRTFLNGAFYSHVNSWFINLWAFWRSLKFTPSPFFCSIVLMSFTSVR